MEIKRLGNLPMTRTGKKDAIDIPDCYGEYNKHNKLCSTYCSISIRCCVMRANHPKIDILENLLLQNDYAVKPN
jgi:hypothetical protein